jgi:hypothetical protein
MREYDFTGLSSRSFEKMIQALALKALGSGITVFGDGADGGREATFDGKLGYPSESAPWSGYGIVQSKFRQRPSAPAENATWLISELRKELTAFAQNRRHRRRPPEYYILATNVVLSPVHETGGKDRVDALFAELGPRIGIRDWRIWDYDQIRAFLDDNSDVRQAYAAFVTAGDVLAELLTWFRASKADFVDVLTNFLAKELIAAQYANLEQAGYAGEGKIALARVFVDLPCTEGSTGRPESSHFVALACSAAADKLDPSNLAERQLTATGHPNESASPGRYVLIGGPGQGKTTLGQFVCQLYRAAILHSTPIHKASAELQQAIESVELGCKAEGIEIPATRRFPLHIVLSEFAAWIAQTKNVGDSPLTLLQFLVERIARRTARTISVDDFRAWLSQYPWLLVLDGLDEVPSSSNRDDLLRQVEEFWVDVAQSNADVLVIATTRPQGYNNDFSPRAYRHKHLMQLENEAALHYAGRLVDARYPRDQDRRDRLMRRLTEASTQQATARLMRSPLQITIMATLLEQIGRAPQDRWRLFHEYYQTIYRREMERETPFAELLSRHRSDVDVIHNRVALMLQLETEATGGTEARLDAERFRQIVLRRLEEKGYPEDERIALAERLRDAAETRLVFLVSPAAGTVGFEIRSLQEFMAAQALMSGDTNAVQARLRSIAGSVSWQNVFIFAAGRCFTLDEHLIDTIYTICVQLNQDLAGRLGSEIRAGSVLAAAVLEDGVADRQPRYGILFAKLALDDIAPGVTMRAEALASAYSDTLRDVFVSTLNQALSSADRDRRLDAWTLLLPLVGAGQTWALGMADAAWHNAGSEERDAIVESPAAYSAQAWTETRIADYLQRNGPKAWGATYILANTKEANQPPWMYRLSDQMLGVTAAPTPLQVMLPQETLVSVNSLDGIDLVWWQDFATCTTGGDWQILNFAAEFAQRPSAAALADLLRACAKGSASSLSSVLHALQWPAVACIDWCKDAAAFLELVDAAVGGDLGDVDDWRRAEERWRTGRVGMSDLLALPNGRLPFDHDVATRGFPLIASRYIHDAMPNGLEEVRALVELFKNLSHDRSRSHVASWVITALAGSHGSNAIDSVILMEIVNAIDSEQFMILDFLSEIHIEREVILHVADLLGRNLQTPAMFRANLVTEVVKALSADRSRTGLLRLLAKSLQYRSVFVSGAFDAIRSEMANLDPWMYVGTDSFGDALLIRVACGSVTKEEVDRFAEAIVLTEKRDNGFIGRVLDATMAMRSFAMDAGEELLFSIKRLQDERNDSVMEGLKSLYMRRRSSLRDLADSDLAARQIIL